MKPPKRRLFLVIIMLVGIFLVTAIVLPTFFACIVSSFSQTETALEAAP